MTRFPLFTEFVFGLAQFAVRDQDREQKLQFLFRIYDMDRDGYISNGELFQVRCVVHFLLSLSCISCDDWYDTQVLKMMTGKNLTNSQLQQIVDRTILYLDKDADGKISYEEFRALVKKNANLSHVTNSMTLDL